MSHKRTGSSKTFLRGVCLLCAAFILVAAPLHIADVASKELAVSASVNGVEIGIVKNISVLENAYGRLRSTAYKISDAAAIPEFKINYDYTYENTDNLLTEDDCYRYLWSQVSDQFCEAYMLYVDDKQAGANLSEDKIKTVIETIEKQLLEALPDEYSAVEISSLIRIEKQLCHTSELRSADEINSLLNPLLCSAIPTINKDEVISHREPALTVSSPMVRSHTRNSELALDYTLISSAAVTEDIPYETVYIDDYDTYIGTETVMSEGKNGSKSITYELIYDDSGMLISQTVVSEDIVSEPVSKVILVGCAEKPVTEPTGNFIWPCLSPKGVSSYYGWRDLYGKQDFHLGIDIPDKAGSLIWASDGGTVKFTGYGYSYGHYIIIEHNNNFSTLYAHLKSISVNKGDLVYQGQKIGTMGSTGVAYGTHLHFEVRIDNKTVDPMTYLPK